MLKLPRKYLITGEDPTKKNNFLETLKICLDNGFKLIQFRAKNLSIMSYNDLASAAINLCEKYDALLVLNCDIDNAIKLNGKGLHLTSKKLLELNKKPENLIVSASCHDSQQLYKAEQLGIDFVTLSPVLPTKTHAEASPLGWDEFEKLARKVVIPVYALKN